MFPKALKKQVFIHCPKPNSNASSFSSSGYTVPTALTNIVPLLPAVMRCLKIFWTNKLRFSSEDTEG